jgi:hypothetical protein
MRSFTGWVALMMNYWEGYVSLFPCTNAKRPFYETRGHPYLLGDLGALLGAALVASGTGSGVLLRVGLSILLSSLLRMCMREKFFVSCLRAPSSQSRRRSGAAKRDTYRSLHHFVDIEVIWGGDLSRSRERKEMDILRCAELEGLRERLRSSLPKCVRGAEKEILANQREAATGARSGPCFTPMSSGAFTYNMFFSRSHECSCM